MSNTNYTDTEILDWMQREGLESIVRCPQFAPGDKVAVVLWASHWTWHETHKVYTTLREAALAGMEASARPVAKAETREEMLERLADEESEALMPGGFQ